MFKLYPRLAWQNLRKNYRVTIPYLLSGSGIIMMYYMICALTRGAENSEFYGARTSASALGLGVVVVAIFGAIFLFYTNSFLMKRRKKELGLYNILGMEKRHIAGVILSETLLTALICLGLGLTLGVIFSKLFFLILERLLGMANVVPFLIPLPAIVQAVVLFGCIFLATALYNILQVRLSKPIELLHGGEVGEKEPKAHWVLAVLGLGLLGTGYYLSLSITSPVDALVMFFVAVVLVILGTYLLFIVGITALLKLLKKNKSFYYRTKHFTTVSGMLYRMKQNAAGLASICILFTCLLVTVSTTFSLYTGVEDAVNQRCPQDVEVSFAGVAEEDLEELRQEAAAACARNNAQMENIVNRRSWLFACSRVDNTLYVNSGLASSIYASFDVYSIEDYNQYFNDSRTLAADQVLLYDPAGTFPYDTMTVFDKTYQVEKIDLPGRDRDTSYMMGYESYALVLNDPAVIDGEKMWVDDEDNGRNQSWYWAEHIYRFDVAGHDPDTVKTVAAEIREWIDSKSHDWKTVENGEGFSMSFMSKPSIREDFTSLYGGVFFLGLFMGAMFLMGTVLIIYYKQVSEGYEDARRFEIMQKVGMSQEEVKRSIHSQVLLVFFLPLATAVMHLCFAFPMLQKILALMNAVNVQLIVTCMA
ncbi:MAG: ABC transporter permease, partial [Acutalibacter sp.]|nr:ABC transporter permease [Acutalibacter sp.]